MSSSRPGARRGGRDRRPGPPGGPPSGVGPLRGPQWGGPCSGGRWPPAIAWRPFGPGLCDPFGPGGVCWPMLAHSAFARRPMGAGRSFWADGFLSGGGCHGHGPEGRRAIAGGHRPPVWVAKRIGPGGVARDRWVPACITAGRGWSVGRGRPAIVFPVIPSLPILAPSPRSRIQAVPGPIGRRKSFIYVAAFCRRKVSVLACPGDLVEGS